MNNINVLELYDFKKQSDLNPPSSACAKMIINDIQLDVGFRFENRKVKETFFDYAKCFLIEYCHKDVFDDGLGDEIRSEISRAFNDLYNASLEIISINRIDPQYDGIKFSSVVGEDTELETYISGIVRAGKIYNSKIDGCISLSDVEEDLARAVQREQFKNMPHVSSFENIMFSMEDKLDFISSPKESDFPNLEDFGMATAVFDNGTPVKFTFYSRGIGYETDLKKGTLNSNISDKELRGMSKNLIFDFYEFMKADIKKNINVEIAGSSENKFYLIGTAGKDLPGSFSLTAIVQDNGEISIDEVKTSGVLNPPLLSKSYDIKKKILEKIAAL